MAKTNSPGEVLQSWVSPKFAREIRELAESDGRSVSSLIKVALRDRLSDETSPSTAEAARPAGAAGPPKAPPGAGSEEVPDG